MKVKLPATLPAMIVGEAVLLPGCFLAVRVAETSPNWPLALRLLQRTDSTVGGAALGVVPTLADDPVADPLPADVSALNQIGTAANVLKVSRTQQAGEAAVSLLLEGLCRFHVDAVVNDPLYSVAITQLDMLDTPSLQDATGAEADARLGQLVSQFKASAVRLIDLLKPRMLTIHKLRPLLDRSPVGLLCDMVVTALPLTRGEHLAMLNSVDLHDRYAAGKQLLDRQILVLSAASQVGRQLHSIDLKRQRQIMLKKRLEQIQRELAEVEQDNGSKGDVAPGSQPPSARKSGELDEDIEDSSLEQLRHRIATAHLPAHVLRAAQRELRKLKAMEASQHAGPEHQKTVGYLEWLADLPWGRLSEGGPPSLAEASAALDRDHYGLERVKRRILELLAVRWRNPDCRGTIICFVGPPGVGKTSLGRSVASTLGREFHRISLGGVRDEAEVRGFNRTYVGAQPGRLIRSFRKASTSDAVVLLDEIDKVQEGGSSMGSPSAALLEVLDPAQNHAFVDHFLGVPYDLSKIIFLATANTVTGIQPPLLDRMEVIELPGYTLLEKLHIAQHHLIPRQLSEHALSDQDLVIPESAVMLICERYTREPGVRRLEQLLAAVCRAAVVRLAGQRSPTDEAGRIECDAQLVEEILGTAPFAVEDSPASRVLAPGVAIGLAASTSGGGSLLYIEAALMAHGSGKLILTGSLGDVIKESAQIALGWLRSNAVKLDSAVQTAVEAFFARKRDLHIHFPQGAVAKDGPSAGVTLVVVLFSLMSEQTVRRDTALTGEVTLSGAVLPVGGIVQKVLAAHRRGIRRVILPRKNVGAAADIPPDVRKEVELVFVDCIDQVLQHAFHADGAGKGGHSFASPMARGMRLIGRRMSTVTAQWRSMAEDTLPANVRTVAELRQLFGALGPQIPLNGDAVRVLSTPTEFYEHLLGGIRHAKKRLSLTSLYLGSDSKERALVAELTGAMERNKDLLVNVLLDKTRGTRGQQNSATLLSPLLHQHGDKMMVSMFQIPQLSGWRRLIPRPFNESIGLTHIKAYIFDDALLISGANLSDHYFGPRQDRYILVKSQLLSDFFAELTSMVAAVSHELQPDGGFLPAPVINGIDKNPAKFQEVVRDLLCELIGSWIISCKRVKAETADTWIYPLYQMGPFHVRQDELATLELLARLPADARVSLSTGYFNLTPRFTRGILQSPAKFDILTAAPRANGFFGARGILGHVPACYTYIEQQFVAERDVAGRTADVRLHEYARPSWTFHAKGLWAYLPGESSPALTFVGSPNFGHRSVNRDLEAQIALVTENDALRERLCEEREALFQHSSEVGMAELHVPDRKVASWEKLVTSRIRSFL